MKKPTDCYMALDWPHTIRCHYQLWMSATVVGVHGCVYVRGWVCRL